ATGHPRGTLVNALLHRYGAAAFSIAGARRPGIVHRLDRDTSGVMLVARDDASLAGLQAQLEARAIRRRYLALVDGEVAPEGRFDTPYGRDRRDGKRYTSRLERIAGEPQRALTCFRLVEALRGASLVEAWLETGRTHQIRVHFRDGAHPVLGDPIYGWR